MKYLSLLIFFFIFSCEINNNIKKLPFFGQYDVIYNNNSNIPDTIYPKIPVFKYYNHDSILKVSNIDYKDKIIIADFFFTSCPTICPKMTKNLKRVNSSLKKYIDEIQFISFTINPKMDTPTILRKYRKTYNIKEKNWDFLYGDEEKTHLLGVDNFLIFAHKDIESEGGYAHSPAFVLVDKNRYVRGVYIGTDKKDVDRLINDIKLLVKND